MIVQYPEGTANGCSGKVRIELAQMMCTRDVAAELLHRGIAKDKSMCATHEKLHKINCTREAAKRTRARGIASDALPETMPRSQTQTTRGLIQRNCTCELARGHLTRELRKQQCTSTYDHTCTFCAIEIVRENLHEHTCTRELA